MQKCSNQSCQEAPIFFCVCCNQISLWCENDYYDHALGCPEKTHDLKHLKSINFEAYNCLLSRIIEVKDQTIKIKNEISIETEKIVHYHEEIIKKALEANERLRAEMDAIISQCETIINKINEPVINKSYYNPLEYILINDISKSANILKKIIPPQIVETKTGQELCEKIVLKTSFFNYILNTYSEYSIYVRGKNTCEVVTTDGININPYYYPTIDHQSRFLFVSPHEIMITGGIRAPNENQCLLLDTENGQFSSLAKMNCKRYWHASTLFKGCPVVIGGCFNNKELNSVEILEFGEWRAMPSIKRSRWSCLASCSFDKIFVFGGNYDTKTIDVFYEEKNEWEEIDVEFGKRISPGIISLYGDYILIFGGKGSYNYCDDTFKVDLSIKKISKMNPLPHASNHPYGCYSINNSKFLNFVIANNFSGGLYWEFEEEINLS